MNIEVLRGGGLRTEGTPARNKIHEVIDVCCTVVVDVTLTDASCFMQCVQVICINIAIAVQVTVVGAVVDVIFADIQDQA